MKKYLTLLMTLVMVLSLLTACGKNDTPSSNTPSAAGKPDNTKAAADSATKERLPFSHISRSFQFQYCRTLPVGDYGNRHVRREPCAHAL